MVKLYLIVIRNHKKQLMRTSEETEVAAAVAQKTTNEDFGRN